MPVSFPAHQSAVLPLKMLRPQWFDATALVVGSASPDLMYGLWNPDWLSSHSVAGLLIWCVPFTVIYAVVLRRWAADGLFGSLPDLGPLRLRSYRVLGERAPSPFVTVSFLWAERPEIGLIFAIGAFLAIGLLVAGVANQVTGVRHRIARVAPPAATGR